MIYPWALRGVRDLRHETDLGTILAEFPEFFAVLSVVLGLLVGSFLNVVIYRLPREGRGPSEGRSHCPSCQAQIRAIDNIPVVSWLFLRGRCRVCKAPISFRYPLIELLTGLAFWGLLELTLAQGYTGTTLVALTVLRWVFFAALFAASVIDLDFQILPDVITKPGMLVGVLASAMLPVLHRGTWVERLLSGPFGFGHGLAGAITGCLAGILVMGAIRSFASWVYGREAMGLGDVKLMGTLGAFVGFEGIFFVLLIGAFAGSAMGLLNVVRLYVYRAWRTTVRGARRPRFSWAIAWLVGRVIPFGPALALGGVITLLWRSELGHFVLETWPNWLREQLL